MAAARGDEPLGSLEIDGVLERRGKSSDGDDCYLVGGILQPPLRRSTSTTLAVRSVFFHCCLTSSIGDELNSSERCYQKSRARLQLRLRRAEVQRALFHLQTNLYTGHEFLKLPAPRRVLPSPPLLPRPLPCSISPSKQWCLRSERFLQLLPSHSPLARDTLASTTAAIAAWPPILRV